MRRRSGSGDGGEDGDELAELARSIDRAAMPPHVHKVRKHVVSLLAVAPHSSCSQELMGV